MGNTNKVKRPSEVESFAKGVEIVLGYTHKLEKMVNKLDKKAKNKRWLSPDMKSQYVGDESGLPTYVVEQQHLIPFVNYIMEGIKGQLGFSLEEVVEFNITQKKGPYKASHVKFCEDEPYFEISVRGPKVD